MIAKQIKYFDHTLILACDANCGKAWGHNGRPQVQLSDYDFEYLADGELGEAPTDPGTYEGGHGKPQVLSERLNKWCCRECERSVTVEPGTDFHLPAFVIRLRQRVVNHRRLPSC